MAEWLFSFLDTTYYLVNNLYCTMSTLEFIASKVLTLFSYIDLLVDISETFSIMIVIMLIIGSSISTLIHVHDLSSSSKSNKSVYSVTYSTYLKFIQFKNRI